MKKMSESKKNEEIRKITKKTMNEEKINKITKIWVKLIKHEWNR